jgi:hypothetical protein
MHPPKARPDPERQARIVAELRRDRDLRLQGYRDQALRIFPHVCARCGRAFSGKRLRELTVHHRDHNFRNNPPDGSNWELLCVYCHDHEHEKSQMEGYAETASGETASAGTFQPFEGLDALLKPKAEPPSAQTAAEPAPPEESRP